jgi:hypothetical protein
LAKKHPKISAKIQSIELSKRRDSFFDSVDDNSTWYFFPGIFHNHLLAEQLGENLDMYRTQLIGEFFSTLTRKYDFHATTPRITQLMLLNVHNSVSHSKIDL